MDPHEKVNMDAEKVMSGSWDFGFMVKKTFKKLARTAKFHITPLGSLIATIYKPRKSLKGLKGPRMVAKLDLSRLSLEIFRLNFKVEIKS